MTTTITTVPDLQQLADRAEIVDLVSLLGACLDDGSFDEMAELLAEDATVRTPGGQAEGRAAVIAQATRTHPAGQSFHHVITNVLVDVDGDLATARANLVVHISVPGDGPGDPHAPAPAPAPRAGIGEVYHFGLSRTPAGWRISWIEIVPVWLSGTLPPTPPSSAA